MTYPKQTCLVCRDYEGVFATDRGFPPDTAKRRLEKRCRAKGHTCDAQYTSGFDFSEPARGQTP